MAQTSRQQSPWQPPNAQDAFMPPAKRQRLSPNPGSPYATSPSTPYANSPTYSNIALPNGAFNNARPNAGPVADYGRQMNGNVMGPPQRPEKGGAQQAQRDEKPLDINEINDLVASSGVNLKDEEDFLNASYRGRTANAGLGMAQTLHPSHASYDLLGQTRFDNVGAARTSFAAVQPKVTEEEELLQRQRAAARQYAQNNTFALQNPFFWAASVRKRMQTITKEHGLHIPIEGLFDRIAERPEPMSGSRLHDTSGHGIQVTRAPSMLTQGAPLDPILSLLTLAGNERVRTLVEDAYGLARARQQNSDGEVPPEWTDTAIKKDPEATLASGNSDEPFLSSGHLAKTLNEALMRISKQDRAAEESRLKLREARRKRKAQQSATATPGTAPGTPSSTSKTLPPGMLGEKAPEVKMTKKEREKAAKQDLGEEVAAREANATATMQIGGKQYSWLHGSANKAKSLPRLPLNSKAGGQGNAAGQKASGLNAIEDRTFGTASSRESGVGGRGVQLRDWVTALERDGHEKRTLTRALLQLDEALAQATAASASAAALAAAPVMPRPSTINTAPGTPGPPVSAVTTPGA